MTPPRVVLVGVGNEWRSDDAAGLHVVRRLREELGPAVEVVECEGEPVGLLEAWRDAALAVVVDAVCSGAPPGTLHRLDASAESLPEELFRGSTHALGVAEAVELARALGRLPARLVVVGLEGERFAAGERLSPAVEAALPEALAAVRAELQTATEEDRCTRRR